LKRKWKNGKATEELQLVETEFHILTDLGTSNKKSFAKIFKNSESCYSNPKCMPFVINSKRMAVQGTTAHAYLAFVAHVVSVTCVAVADTFRR
jgi:hypothetical protein